MIILGWFRVIFLQNMSSGYHRNCLSAAIPQSTHKIYFGAKINSFFLNLELWYIVHYLILLYSFNQNLKIVRHEHLSDTSNNMMDDGIVETEKWVTSHSHGQGLFRFRDRDVYLMTGYCRLLWHKSKHSSLMEKWETYLGYTSCPDCCKILKKIRYFPKKKSTYSHAIAP